MYRKLDIRNISTWVHINWFIAFSCTCPLEMSTVHGTEVETKQRTPHWYYINILINLPSPGPFSKKLIFQRILASNLLRIKNYKTEGHYGKGVSRQCLIFWSIKSALQKPSKNIKKKNIYHLHIILACSCKPWLLWDYVKPTLFSAVTDGRPYDTELIKFKFLVCSWNTDGNSIPGGEDISHKGPHISPCSRNVRHFSIQQELSLSKCFINL